MELELLGLTGLAAFLVGGGVVMLIASFRRTVELRAALIHAMRRIDRLERTLASGKIEYIDTAEQIGDAAPLKSIAFAGAEEGLSASADAQQITEASGIADNLGAVAPPHPAVSIAVLVLAACAALAAARTGAVLAPAGAAIAILAGLCALGAAEWSRATTAERPNPFLAWRPDGTSANALCGLLVISATIFYTTWVLNALHPETAFGLSAVTAIGSVLIAPRYGQLMFGVGALMLAATPLLAPLPQIAPLAHFGFLLAGAATLMLQARRTAQNHWAWIAAAIFAAWAAIDIASAAQTDIGAIGPLLFALCGFAALGGADAWSETGRILNFPSFWRAEAFWRERATLGALISVAAAILFAAAIMVIKPTPSEAGAALAAFATVGLGFAAMRQGQWLAAWIGAVLAIGALALWPNATPEPIDAASLLTYAAALGFIFTIGGGLMMTLAIDPRAGAALAALVPIAALAFTHERLPDFGVAPIWALAALGVMALNGVAYFQFAKSWPNVSQAFAAGALLSGVVALYLLTPAAGRPIMLSLCLPALAIAARFRPNAGFAIAAQILSAVVFIKLVAPELSIAHAHSAATLSLYFLLAVCAVLAAGLIFHVDKNAPPPPASQAAYILCAALVASLVTLVARHLATAGAIGEPYANLGEVGANTLVWLGAATFLLWRFGPHMRDLPRAFEFLSFAAALTHAILAAGLLINPWWGLVPAPPTPIYGISAIIVAYLLPGLLFLFYAHASNRRGAALRSQIALVAGLLMCFLALNLEIRALFHGVAMPIAPVTYPEAWSYSLGWLGFAAALMVLPSLQMLAALRVASLVLASAAMLKISVADAGVFGLAAHAMLATILLLVAIASAWYYRRTLAPWLFPPLQAPRQNSNSMGDANLAQRS